MNIQANTLRTKGDRQSINMKPEFQERNATGEAPRDLRKSHEKNHRVGEGLGLRDIFRKFVGMSRLVREAEILARKKDYPSAYKLLNRADAKGVAEASYALGTWHLYGRFVKKDFPAAVQYLSKAAKQGNADALFNLAVCYERGEGVKKDLKKAHDFYLLAFVYGDRAAAYEIGRMLYYGLGIEKDQELAESFIAVSKQKNTTARRSASKDFIKRTKASSLQIA